MEHKIKETYEFIHNGISVFVRIDYFNNQISILECTNKLRAEFRKKELVFIGRGVEYMNGWLNILEAHKEAIKDAKKKYEANLALESKFREDKIVELLSPTS